MIRPKLAGAALVFTISAICSAPYSFAEPSSDVETIYISNDLDGTLFDTIKDRRQVDEIEYLIKASDGEHQPVWGASAFIQSQIDLPERFKNRKKSNGKALEVKTVFFSGGDAERNQTLLSHIVLKDGKSAFDHAYKVLSANDLTPITDHPPEGAHHSDWLKKDLRKIAPNIDLNFVAHVDDIPTFVLPGQEKNVIAIDPGYSHVGNYSRYLELKRHGLELHNPPPSREAWAYDSQRLIYAAGVIEEAIDLMYRREDMSFRDAITYLQQTNDSRRFLEVGKKVLSKYTVDHSRFAHEAKCPGLLEDLARILVK